MYEQLLLHLCGDYILQTDKMASKKTTSMFWAVIHTICYTIPFAILTRSVVALLIIGITHFWIDHLRLARYVVFAKNWVTDHTLTWEDCKATGYPSTCPPWLSVWLMIIVDNIIHLVTNYFTIRYL